MTERIREFLRDRRDRGLDTEPCLVVDLDVVRENYQSFAKALPDSRQVKGSQHLAHEMRDEVSSDLQP